MTERFTKFPDFDQQGIQDTLDADSRPARDVAHGDGTAFRFGEPPVELEVYPAAGAARVTTADARLELFRLPGVSVNDQPPRVVFDQGDEEQRTRLAVRPDGKVSFTPVIRAVEVAPATASAQDSPTTRSDRQDAPAASTAADSTAPETGKDVSVTLRGRLGRDVWFRSGDEPVAGFPLAVNDEHGGATTWHKVVTFGETAEALHEAASRGQIKKGRLVDATGQTVVREEGKRKQAEFHATSVSRVDSRSTRGPSAARPGAAPAS